MRGSAQRLHRLQHSLPRLLNRGSRNRCARWAGAGVGASEEAGSPRDGGARRYASGGQQHSMNQLCLGLARRNSSACPERFGSCALNVCAATPPAARLSPGPALPRRPCEWRRRRPRSRGMWSPVAGKHLLVRVFGSVSFGDVYAARPEGEGNEIVAMKLMEFRGDGQEDSCIHCEAETWRRLAAKLHPSVIRRSERDRRPWQPQLRGRDKRRLAIGLGVEAQCWAHRPLICTLPAGGHFARL